MILLVPSRGRPQRAAGMAHSARSTAVGPVRVLVIVDADDPELPNYRRKVRDLLILPERVGYSGALNAGAAAHLDEHEIAGAFGDDVLFRTNGWDARIAQVLTTPGFAFPNDLAHRHGWATAVWVNRAIVKALGWLAYPGCRHQYVDNVWWELGHATDSMRYVPEVVAEHMHVAYGKAPQDQTYQEVYSMPQAGIDHDAFEAWKQDGMAADVAKVRAVL